MWVWYHRKMEYVLSYGVAVIAGFLIPLMASLAHCGFNHGDRANKVYGSAVLIGAIVISAVVAAVTGVNNVGILATVAVANFVRMLLVDRFDPHRGFFCKS